MKSLLKVVCVLTGWAVLLPFVSAAGVKVGIELPPEPGKYLVSVAAARADDPTKLVATFVAGEVFTVEAGRNRFAVEWNGLDDNHMPVPAGRYAIRAVYAPARLWPVDGQYHAFTAKYVGGIGALLPDPATPEIWTKPVPVEGDPVNSPLLDIDVTPDGRGTFGFQYMENGRSCPLVTFNGAENATGKLTFHGSWPSGGAGTTCSVTTDGETVWGMSGDNSSDFIFRPDGRRFGNQDARYRRGVHLAKGKVTDMASWKRPDGSSVVAFTENGVMSRVRGPRGHDVTVVSSNDFVDAITLLAGADGAALGQISVRRPTAMKCRDGRLYVLYRPDDATWSVGAFTLVEGLPSGALRRLFDVRGFRPGDLAVDGKGRFYVSDPDGNHVCRLSATGKVELKFGRLDAQVSGTYDPETMMKPWALSVWRDAKGRERLLVIERDGPNRTSEWDAETGAYLGEYASYQTRCNSGYMIDPEHPTHVYLPAVGNYLVRFLLDYDTGVWKTDAVFPNVSAGMREHLEKAVAVRRNGRLYFASEHNGWIYRLTDDGRRIVKSAALFHERNAGWFWHDANGNGEVDENEKTAVALPGWVFTYHGQTFLDDLSYLAAGLNTRCVFRAAPTSFDAHGNPVFTKWEQVLEDPVFKARAEGRPSALEGGNELDDRYSSDWMKSDGAIGGSLFVQARGGRNFNANAGAQYKITRYDPDGKGGYKMAWRVGRAALHDAKKADLFGGMRLFKPVNGIFSVIDQSRSGVYLYTDTGIYLDTLFAPGETARPQGVYRQPGEFFCGTVLPNRENGRIYYMAGKFTPFVYEIENWTTTSNPVKSVPRHTKFVQLEDKDIVDPPEVALVLRGGAGKARFCSFAPAVGGIETEGATLRGWESAPTVDFTDLAGTAKVEVKTLWSPDALYLRWHVRKPEPLVYRSRPAPERLFVHDIEADTLGFYFRGDSDARFTFGLFKDEKGALCPMGVGFYEKKPVLQKVRVRPQAYKTPVGETAFAHVGLIVGAKYGFSADADGKGFSLSVALPRAALPFASAKTATLSPAFRTRVNFDANLGGHNRFWWANTDGSANTVTYDEPSEARLCPGSWAQARFTGLADGLVLTDWMKLGPFGGPGSERFGRGDWDKPFVRDFYRAQKYAPDSAAYDPKKDYRSSETSGWWGKSGAVMWTPAEMRALDNRAVFATQGAQVWYGATFLTALEPAEVTLRLYAISQAHADWKLNGEPLSPTFKEYVSDPRVHARTYVETKVKLRKGVNELRFRGAGGGYMPFLVGAEIRAPEATLWKIGLGNPYR